MDFDRLPPSSPQAEAGVLGCALLDPGTVLDECTEANVSPEWFYDLRHQHIFVALQELEQAGTSIDPITLGAHLSARHLLEECGGYAYFSSLMDLVPSAANLLSYVVILREKWLLREVLRTAVSAVGEVQSIEQGQKTEPEALIARLEKEILRLSEERSANAEEGVALTVSRVQEGLEDYHRGHAQIQGLTTGLDYVDKLLCGIGQDNGNYIVLAGRPGTGKTSLAMQIALHVLLDFVWFAPAPGGGPPGEDGKPPATRRVGAPVGVFSLEMSRDALVKRMLFQRAKADLQRWRTGFAEKDDVKKLRKAGLEIANAKLFIDDEARLTIDTLRARARRMFRQHGIKLFIVDYIQLMRSSARRHREDRVQELAEISSEFMALGKEFNVPFIILAQMNRDFEKEPTRVPRLSDLKDCGSIEQDADLCGFLHTPKMNDTEKERYIAAMRSVYDGDDWSKRPARVNLHFAKNRYGMAGKCELLFQKSSTFFHDYNVWLKKHAFKELAAGDSRSYEPPPEERQEEFET